MKIHGQGNGKTVYEGLCYKKQEPSHYFNYGNLPHREQENTLQFVTFRLNDSLPRQVVSDLRQLWDELLKEPDSERRRLFEKKYQSKLDAGFGSCKLMNEECCKAMIDSLRHYDGVTYDLFDYVVMPNHVHVILLPYNGELAHCIRLLKGRSARMINKILNTSGSVWQHGYFDRMIRSVVDYENKAAYILENASSVRHLINRLAED